MPSLSLGPASSRPLPVANFVGAKRPEFIDCLFDLDLPWDHQPFRTYLSARTLRTFRIVLPINRVLCGKSILFSHFPLTPSPLHSFLVSMQGRRQEDGPILRGARWLGSGAERERWGGPVAVVPSLLHPSTSSLALAPSGVTRLRGGSGDVLTSSGSVSVAASSVRVSNLAAGSGTKCYRSFKMSVNVYVYLSTESILLCLFLGLLVLLLACAASGHYQAEAQARTVQGRKWPVYLCVVDREIIICVDVSHLL